MPKVFISFLGTADYRAANYFVNGDKTKTIDNLRFVQEALLCHFSEVWQLTENDRILVFVTPEAKRLNWFDAEHINNFTKEKNWREGLKTRLDKLGIKASYTPVDIENGKSEAEIWEIFDKVYQNLNNGDEVFFDITFGFRSLPMLAMVLVDFAKFLKNIKVSGIYYGADEAKEEGKTPIWNLNSFAELQAWTTAAQSFFNSGNASLLSELVQPANPVLAQNLSDFTEAILTCRGKMLTQDLDVNSFKSLVNLGRSTGYEAQLKPILERVGEKLEKFESQNTKNGFAAVEWCIDNGLVQQGYTFLQETTVSYVLERVLGSKNLMEYKYRDAASAALNGYTSRKSKPFLTVETTKMFDFVQEKIGLIENYTKLTGNTGLRNDINHAGFKDKFATPSQLRNDLKDIYTAIKNILD